MLGIEKQSDEVKNLLESPGSREGACEWLLMPSGHQSGHLALCHITGEGRHRLSQASGAPPQDCKLWSEEVTCQLGNATCPAWAAAGAVLTPCLWTAGVRSPAPTLSYHRALGRQQTCLISTRGHCGE